MDELDLLLRGLAERRGTRGFTFDDLARLGARRQATISTIADWLAAARSSGLVEDLGFDRGAGPLAQGPRRYRLPHPAPGQ